MKKISGLKLNFTNNGESVNFEKGKSLLPHRTEYIKKKLDVLDFTGLDDIFFEDPVPDHNNESTLKQAYIEGQLMNRYIELLKEGDTRRGGQDG